MKKLYTLFAALALLFAPMAHAVISSPTVAIIANGNGSTTSFNYSFWVPYQANGSTPAVVVTLTDPSGALTVLVPTAYTISGVNNPAGGAVHYPLSGSPLPSGWKITIARALAYIQPTAVPNSPFYPHTVETVADNLDAQTQQLANVATRSIVVPQGETGYTLPAAIARANKLLGFDAGGAGYLYPIGIQPGAANANTTAYIAPYTGAVLQTVANSLKNTVNVTDFGAKCDGATDDTAAIQHAFDLGGEVHFPAGTCDFTTLNARVPMRVVGQVASTGSPSTLLQATGTYSLGRITIGNQASEVNNITFEHLVVSAPSNTTGFIFDFRNVRDSGLDDVQMINLGATSIGVNVFQVNTMHLTKVRIHNPINYGIFAVGDDAHRSDIIVLNQLIVEGDSLGAHTHIPTAIGLDGYVNTVVGQQIYAVAVGRGLATFNDQGATQRAEFVFFNDFEVDFPYVEAILSNYHDSMYFFNSYFHGSVTGSNIVVNTLTPNTSTNIQFIGGNCTGAWMECAYLDGRYMKIEGMQISDNGHAASNTYPGVELGPDSVHTIITGANIGDQSGLSGPVQAFGVKVDSGATFYSIMNNDLSGNITRPIEDQSNAQQDSNSITTPNVGQNAPQSFLAVAATNGGTTTSGRNTTVMLLPAGPLAVYTVVMPTDPANGQEFTLFTTRQITQINLTGADSFDTDSQVFNLGDYQSVTWVHDRINSRWIMKDMAGCHTYSQTWNPPSIGAGAVSAIQTITAHGVIPGNVVTVAMEVATQGLMTSGWVSLADQVQYELFNPTAGAIDLGSGAVKIMACQARP